MENPRQTPQEVREGGEPTETPELQQLNDATHTPEAYVEQIGDFHEAESIQNNLVVLVEDSKAAEKAVSAVAPHVPGQADASQAAASSEDSGGGAVDAIPITVPDVRTSGGEASTLPVPLPSPSAGEASSLPVPIPSPAPEAADEGSVLPIPIPTPGPMDQPSVRGDLKQAETKSGTPKGDEATPINLPDMQEVRRTETTPGAKIRDVTVAAAGEEIDATPIPLPGQEKSATPIPLPGEPETIEGKPSRTGFKAERMPQEGEAVVERRFYNRVETAEAGGAVSAAASVEKGVGEATAGVQSIEPGAIPSGEAETAEGREWTPPPDWYVAIGPNGEAIVVDSDGNPVDSPPLIQTVNPADGSPCNPMVYYKGSGSNPVELPYYSGSLAGCSVTIGADGKPVVVDSSGKPLEVQPTVQTVDASGQPCAPKVYYKGSNQQPVEMSYYNGSLAGCSVNIGADGKAVVVDGNGKPLDAQPIVQTVDASGQPCAPKVYYKGSANAPVELSYYSGSLEDCYLHTGADGKAVVVDGNGVPLASQPIIQTVDAQGKPCSPKIYYKGGEANSAGLPSYSAPLDGCSVHIAADGKATVVDADGKPLASQPIIQTVNPADGKPCPPTAYYKDAGGNPVELPYYTGPKKIDKP
jgi:hypothetical protein